MTDFISGMVGGASGVLCSHPFDTIRVRYQCLSPGQRIYCSGVYRGVIPPLIGMMIEKSIVFGTYSIIKNKTQSNIISGLAAGCISACIITPLEKIKIALQQSKNSAHISAPVKKTKIALVLQHKWSIRELYKGFLPTICREGCGFAIYFPIYHYLKQKYNKDNKDNKHIKTALIGGSSGMGSWLFIYPFDVVKTRLQSPILYYNGVVHCITDTYQKYGYTFFYRGLSLGLSRAFVLHAGVWIGFELCQELLCACK